MVDTRTKKNGNRNPAARFAETGEGVKVIRQGSTVQAKTKPAAKK